MNATILLFFSMISLSLFANPIDDFFVPTDISIKKVESGYENYVYENRNVITKSLGEAIIVTDQLIAIGTKVWEIVKKGEPNLSLKMAKPISIIPNAGENSEAFSKMDSWSAPEVNSYDIEFTNVYGVALVSFRYNVAFQHSGQFEGKGSYITGLQMNASSINVKWGVSFDATSELQSISNRGSMESPIAGATMTLTYQVGTAFSKIVETKSFHMTGSGEFLVY